MILSVVPAHDRPMPTAGWFRLEVVARITEHVAAFGLVGTAFAIGYRWSLFWLFTMAFLYCGGIELLQIPLPTRHARVSDFLIDFAAAAAAIALVRAAESLQGRIGSIETR
jgi:VanZ family protein